MKRLFTFRVGAAGMETIRFKGYAMEAADGYQLTRSATKTLQAAITQAKLFQPIYWVAGGWCEATWESVYIGEDGFAQVDRPAWREYSAD